MNGRGRVFAARWIGMNLYPYAARYKWRLTAGTFISIAVAGVSYHNLRFIRILLDEKLYLGGFRHFLYMLIAVSGIIFIYNLLNWLQANLNSRITINITKEMIEDFYGKSCNMPFSFFHSHSPGELLTLLLNDIPQVAALFPLVFIDLVKNVLILAVVFFYLITTQYEVLLLYVCLGVGYLVITNYFTAAIKKILPDIQGTREALHNKLINYFQAISLFKIYDTKGIEKGKLFELNDRLANQNKRVILLENSKNFLLEFAVMSVISVFVVLGYALINSGVLTAGKFVTILIATYLTNGYVRSLFDIYSKSRQARVYVDRLDKTFGNAGMRDVIEGERGQSAGEGIGMTASVDSVVFDGVNFIHNGNALLRDVTCAFEKGCMTGITGESGYGKTTLLNLILKLIHPSSGEIRINGISIRDIDAASYLKQIAYLPQNSLLFNGTIAENIAFGDERIDMDKVIRSANTANIHDFISCAPSGYDTPVSAGILAFSEGEKKRIEIARALYKDSSIIIMDEPTANLDLKNKVAIIEALKAIRGKVVIVVSHDLNVLENCGMILLINAKKEAEILPSHESVYHYYAQNTRTV